MTENRFPFVLRNALNDLCQRVDATQGEIAKHAGVTDSTLSDAKNGKCGMGLLPLLRICQRYEGYEIPKALGELGGFEPVRPDDDDRIRELCAARGGRYITGSPLDPATAAQSVEHTIADAVAALGAVQVAAGAILVGGPVSPENAATLLTAAAPALTKLEQLIAHVRQCMPMVPATRPHLAASIGGGRASG